MVRRERLELSHLAAPEPKSGVSTNFTTSASGVTDGDRTHDHRNHNPALYRLSYGHLYMNYLSRLLSRTPH